MPPLTDSPRWQCFSARAPQLEQYRLEFDDGSSVVVLSRGFIGREPAPPPGALVQHLVRLSDGTLSLSRTHLEFDPGESGLWVRDCDSTNGSEILINGRRTVLVPGVQVATPSGCTIYMGTSRLKVTATAGRAVIGGATVDWGVATRLGARREARRESGRVSQHTLRLTTAPPTAAPVTEVSRSG